MLRDQDSRFAPETKNQSLAGQQPDPKNAPLGTDLIGYALTHARREEDMAADDRRNDLLARLREATGPLSGGRLAKQLGVSRQIIVGDVAVLRAAGHDIVSTARGYVLARPAATKAPANGNVASPDAGERPTPFAHGLHTREIKAHHTVEQTSDELLTILENGGEVVDVSVSHRVYGRISAQLDIATRADALRFIHDIETGKSAPLLTVTSGYHYHTIAADSEATLDRIERALDSKGYLAPRLPYEQR